MSFDRSIAIKGVKWTSVSTVATVITQFVRIMILTRFLEKSDFGIVSIVNAIIGLCITFTDLGFSSVIMYKNHISSKEFSTLFWVQLMAFGILYLVLWCLSSLVASFYDEEKLITLIPLAALTVIFQALGKLYDTVLQKQFQFKTIAFRNIFSNILSLFVAVVLAWIGFGVYSLIFSTLIYAFILNSWNFIYGQKVQKIFFYCKPKDIIVLIKIGVFQTGTRILDFISDKIDVMIIGKLLGTETLGVYDLSKTLVNKMVDLVRTVISKVALPILSNSNNNDDVVRSRFLVMTKVVAYIVIPIGVVIALFSREILWIVYGGDYTGAFIIVTVFAFISIINSICSFFDMLGVAKGRTDLNFYNTIVRIVITIPIVCITSLFSIEIVAYGQLVATFLQSIIFWMIVVNHTYPISFIYYFSYFSKWLFIQLGCFAVIMPFMNIEHSLILNLCIKAILYIVIVAVSLFCFMRNDIAYFRKIIKRRK